MLLEYAAHASEPAFAELVRRHIDFVHSAAFRMVRNPAMAEEVTQSVFIALSQNAHPLAHRAVLSGWLHRTAQNLAIKVVRSEERRRAREQEAAVMHELTSGEAESIWETMAPHLDAALSTLRKADRTALFLRFFQQRTTRQIAQTLGLSEEAAQKRVTRALERLRNVFAQRGVIVSASGVATALTAHSVQAAPPGLTATVMAKAAAAGCNTVGVVGSVLNLLAIAKLNVTTLSLVFTAGIATPVLLNSNPDSATANASSPKVSLARQGTLAVLRPRAAASREGSAALARLEAWLLEADQTRSTAILNDELRMLILPLPARDLPTAWRMGQRLRWRSLREQFQKELLALWAEVDPHAALAAARTPGEDWRSDSPCQEVLKAWTAKEPTLALAWIRENVPEEHRTSVLARTLPFAVRTDPQAALAALSEIPPGYLYEKTLTAVLDGWAEHDPPAAARHAIQMPASRLRTHLLTYAATAWASVHPDAVLEWSTNLTDKTQRENVLGCAIRHLAMTRPDQAAGLLTQLCVSNAQWGVGPASAIIEHWPHSDLAAAAEWARQLPEGKVRDWATQALLRRLGATEPQQAAEFAAALPANGGELKSVRGALSSWSLQDPKTALDWASALPAGSLHDAAVVGACSGWAASNPQQAATYVANLPPGAAQSGATLAVVFQWALNNPRAAADWVVTFPEGPLREQAAARLISQWGSWHGDTSEAARWLESLPPSPSRDAAACAFVSEVAGRVPRLAAPWIGAIADEAKRNEAVEQITRKWLTTDPDACRTWLQQTTLPEERKRQLLGQ